MKKFILDTNVLIHDPNALNSFEDNNVYIPLEVLRELDGLKLGLEEKNVNARAAIRRLDFLTKEGVISEGINLEGGGKLFFLPKREQPGEANLSVDEKLLEHLRDLSSREEGHTCLVTKDINVRVQAKALGLKAEDYLHDKANMDLNDFFKRQPIHEVPSELINRIYTEKRVPLDDETLSRNFEESQYYLLKAGQQSVLVRYQEGELIKLAENTKIEGITAKNNSQRFLLDACLDPGTTIVSGLGKAGTGKTLLALVAGLHQVLGGSESKRYEKVVVLRPLREGVKDLGYLPGELGDKIGPHFAPIETALEVILGREATKYDGLRDLVDYKPISLVRGDTFHDRYVIVDEAQNFTPRELKLIGTRLGESSKIVMVGDPFQIDNPYLDERSNGLTITTDRLRGKVPEFSYVVLEKVERSRMAEIFAEYL